MEKKTKALNLIESFLNRKKATVREIQSLVWLLKFLNKAIVSDRAFTRHICTQNTVTL